MSLVECKAGKFKGVLRDSCYQFFGIPYAKYEQRWDKSFPIEKKEIIKAILQKKVNLKKIINVVHAEIRKKMNLFLKKNRNKKFVVLDVPLLLENKLNKKGDILIFVDSKKSDILKKLAKRKNFNKKLFNKFQNIQFSSQYKIRKSNFIIKNDFTKKTINTNIKNVKKKIDQ